MSMSVSLTEDQSRIIDSIISAVRSSGESVPFSGVLQGAAGTGKTTTLTALISEAVDRDLRVGVAAFTHKACAVVREKLAEMSVELSLAVNVQTIHALFNLKPEPAKYGEKETFKQSGRPKGLEELDFLIIDECSMIGEELHSIIVKDTKSYGVHLLFAGDACQLRPVGEDNKSPSFKTGEKFKLTEVLRHDGAILDLATAIRTERYIPRFKSASGPESEVIVYKDIDPFEANWLSDVKSGQNSIMLCYTNANRRQYNIRARAALHGVNAPRFMKGDQILALAPVIHDNKVLIANNEIVTILDEPVLEKIKPVDVLPDTHAYNTWRIQTQYGVVYVLDSIADEKLYWKHLRALGREINKEVKTSTDWRVKRDAKARWTREYFPMKSFYSDMDFGFALTIHKSQGSTFQNVYVSNDYTRARADQRRLLYVAVTRAAQTLHLIHNGY